MVSILKGLENNVTAYLFDQALDRAQTEMPEWYLPSAQAVLIAARDILPSSGHRPGTFHAAGWSRGASGFKKASRDGKSVLWVQPCGKFWIIERSIHLDAVYMQDEAPGFRIRRAANLDAHTANCDGACGALRSDAAGAGRGILGRRGQCSSCIIDARVAQRLNSVTVARFKVRDWQAPSPGA